MVKNIASNGVFKVRRFNGVIKIHPRLALVAMVTKIWEF